MQHVTDQPSKKIPFFAKTQKSCHAQMLTGHSICCVLMAHILVWHFASQPEKRSNDPQLMQWALKCNFIETHFETVTQPRYLKCNLSKLASKFTLKPWHNLLGYDVHLKGNLCIYTLYSCCCCCWCLQWPKQGVNHWNPARDYFGSERSGVTIIWNNGSNCQKFLLFVCGTDVSDFGVVSVVICCHK